MSQTTEIQNEAPEGYKRVQLGPRTLPVPTDWEIKRVDEITENLDRKRDPIKSSERESGDIPYYGATGQVDTVSGHLFDEKLVLVGEDGADWSPFGGTSYIISGKSWVNNHVHVLRCTKIVEEFLSNYLDYIEMRQVISGTNRGKLNQSELNQFPVIYPPLPEQRRIADILSTVENQIQQTDDVIEATEELKRGLIQDIFDVNTTSGNSKSDLMINAQKELLGDLVEVISGVHVKSEHVTHDSSETPYLTGPADFTHRGFSVTKYTDKTSKFCEPGDTLVTVKGSGCGNSTLATQKAGISRQLKALRPKDSVDEQYLYYYLQTKTDLLSILAQGTSIPGLSTSDLTTLTISLPKLDVQQQIGDILEKIDDQITIERERKQKFEQLKRGLMQDLLTGKVRVDND